MPKVTVDRFKFARAFGLASSAIHVRTPVEITKNVLLSDNRLIGTSHEVTIMAGDIGFSEDVVSLLPTARINSILSATKMDTIDISFDDRRVIVNNGSGKFTLSTEDPGAFPQVWGEPVAPVLSISAHDLKSAILGTVGATDPTPEKYATDGVNISLGDAAELSFVATDTKRLAVVVCGVELCSEVQPFSCIINRNVIKTVCNALPNDGNVAIAVTKSSAVFSTPYVNVIARLAEGKYPRWQKVLPAGSRISFELPVNELMDLCRQSLIVMDIESRNVTVTFKFRDGVIEMQASTSGVGESVASMPMATQDFDDFEETFYTGYLIDFLKSVSSSGTVEVSLNNHGDVLLFRQGSKRYVIMPMMI